MGNKQSSSEPDPTILDDTKVEELCVVTKLTRKDIVKMHSEFLVSHT
jgi:hypothetical protein